MIFTKKKQRFTRMRPKRCYVDRSPNLGFFIVFVDTDTKQIHERTIPFDSCFNNKKWRSHERSADHYEFPYAHA